MDSVTEDGTTVDVCRWGCGGMFFDQREIDAFDEAREGAGERLLEMVPREGRRIDLDERVRCPKCEDTVMMRRFWSVRRSVEIDECGTCAGLWLDVGELGRLRELYETEEERREAAGAFARDMFGASLRHAIDGGAERAVRVERASRLFTWLLPWWWRGTGLS
jgi:hypothetical protein